MNTKNRSPRFEFHLTDLKKTLRDFLFVAAACAIPAITIATDALIKWEAYDPLLVWSTFAIPFTAAIFAWINRWLTHYSESEDEWRV